MCVKLSKIKCFIQESTNSNRNESLHVYFMSSIENKMEEQFVYKCESRFSCLNLDNSYIKWYSEHYNSDIH